LTQTFLFIICIQTKQ